MRLSVDPGLESGALALDREGRWTHDGDVIRHARLCALLDRCVARDEDGGLIVTTGRDRLPFTSEDAPLRVKTARLDDGRLIQVLRDGREEPLTSTSALCIDDQGRVRTRVEGPRGGTFWALWERPASQALMPLLRDDGTPHLDVTNQRIDVTVLDTRRDWTT
jgi:hypothetical protein